MNSNKHLLPCQRAQQDASDSVNLSTSLHFKNGSMYTNKRLQPRQRAQQEVSYYVNLSTELH